MNYNHDEISVIGAGFVGAAHATYLAQFYEKINLIDRDIELVQKLKSGELPINSKDILSFQNLLSNKLSNWL